MDSGLLFVDDFGGTDNLFDDPHNMTSDWTANPDELLENIFDLHPDFFDNLGEDNINFCDVNALTEELADVGNSINDAALEKIVQLDPPSSISSSTSDSGLSSDNVDQDMSPDYEPLSPALSSPGPSVSERGTQNSPPHQIMDRVYNVPVVKKNPRNMQTVVHSRILDKSESKPIILKAKSNDMKFYKLSPAQLTNGTIIPKTTGKKVTIQLQKSNEIKIPPTATMKTITKPKQVIVSRSPISTNGLNGNGFQKIIRVQQNSGTQQSKQILLPVCIQDVKDVRKIKIINRNNMKQKQQNVGWTATNLIKHQVRASNSAKKVIISNEHLIVDDSSDQASDVDSYSYDDIIQANESILSPMEHSESIVESVDYEDEDMIDDDESMHGVPTGPNGYPKLVLTPEESRLLVKEGITLPSHYPLTKNEERELKRIRRKIRNKISAQDSRKRKKEYVDGLEERVKKCTTENQNLMKRISQLQRQNHTLMSQMKKLQTMLSRGSSKTAQPATCLMVLLLSLALVAVPNLKLNRKFSETELANVVEETLMLQNRRTLLFDTKEQINDAVVDEEINFDDILAFDDMKDHDYGSDLSFDVGNESDDSLPPPPKRARSLIDLDVDDKVWRPPGNLHTITEIKQEKIIQSSGFNIVNDTKPLLEKLDIKSDILSGLANIKTATAELTDGFDSFERMEHKI